MSNPTSLLIHFAHIFPAPVTDCVLLARQTGEAGDHGEVVTGDHGDHGEVLTGTAGTVNGEPGTMADLDVRILRISTLEYC